MFSDNFSGFGQHKQFSHAKAVLKYFTYLFDVTHQKILIDYRGVYNNFSRARGQVKVHVIDHLIDFGGKVPGALHDLWWMQLSLSDIWKCPALFAMRDLIRKKKEIEFSQIKKSILQEELRAVSIRVNLFEKILIPRTNVNIKKIKVFLGDQQLSAVATSKVAKQKKMKKEQQSQQEVSVIWFQM